MMWWVVFYGERLMWSVIPILPLQRATPMVLCPVLCTEVHMSRGPYTAPLQLCWHTGGGRVSSQ